MNRPVISAIGHVAMIVSDVDAAVRNATTLMGLRISERHGDWVDLTHGAAHHSLQYLRSDVDAVDHVGLEAAGPEAVAVIREAALLLHRGGLLRPCGDLNLSAT